eukprot:scaffold2510_cov215-Alexandrium_tamarense.AAC.10
MNTRARTSQRRCFWSKEKKQRPKFNSDARTYYSQYPKVSSQSILSWICNKEHVHYWRRVYEYHDYDLIFACLILLSKNISTREKISGEA